MPDKPDSQELKSLLARIMTQKSEPPDLKETHGQGPERVIEADKIILRDEAGKSRGKISARADGSAGLILSNNEGNAWAWLGINREGEAFLELKDRKGEISFKVPGNAGDPKTAPENPANPVSDQRPEAVPAASDSQGTSQPGADAMIRGAAEAGINAEQAPSAIPPDWQPASTDSTVYDRLEELERKNRGGGISRGIFLGLLLVILALQVFILVRPRSPGNLQVKSLTVGDHNGVLRAWLGEKNGNPVLSLNDPQGKVRAALGLAKDGSPSLLLYDQDHRLRAGLHLWPNGTPKLFLRNHSSLLGKAQPDAQSGADTQLTTAVSNLGGEGGTLVDSVTGEAQNPSQVRDAATETYFVGSKTSNKYHFPECKWAKTIRPSHLIIFKSLKDAQDRGYIPCPACKPPPLSQ
jgi:hypothetical protein